MKIKTLIISILGTIIISSSIAQTDYSFPIKLGIGLGVNTGNHIIKNTFQNNVYNLNVEATNGIGYNFYSNINIRLYKKIWLNTGINVSIFNHSFKSSLSVNDTTIFNNYRFRQYQAGIEIPITLGYELIRLKSNDIISIDVGLMQSSIIAGDLSTVKYTDEGYIFTTTMNTDISSSNEQNPFRNLNIAFTSSISYSKILQNKDFLKFKLNYSRYLSKFYIGQYQLKDENNNLYSYGKIEGYINNISIGVCYKFSFQRSFDEIYKKGYNEGLKIN
jgi:hypothetical protein